MCSWLVLGSMCPVSEQKKSPTNPAKFVEYNPFIPIMDERCQWAALTYICHQECENVDHQDIVFEQRTYVHYVTLMGELKSKCNSKGEWC